jgi:hypothetical protein
VTARPYDLTNTLSGDSVWISSGISSPPRLTVLLLSLGRRHHHRLGLGEGSFGPGGVLLQASVERLTATGRGGSRRWASEILGFPAGAVAAAADAGSVAEAVDELRRLGGPSLLVGEAEVMTPGARLEKELALTQ